MCIAAHLMFTCFEEYCNAVRTYHFVFMPYVCIVLPVAASCEGYSIYLITLSILLLIIILLYNNIMYNG